MTQELELYIPRGPKKLVDKFGPKFQVRKGSSDVRAVEGVWSKNSYRVHRDGFQPKPGDVWLDIGANVGAFGAMAHFFGAEVVSVEAEASNVPLCAANLELNGVDQPIVIEQAVVPDEYVGDNVSLFVHPESTRRHSIARERKISHEVQVPARKISSLLDEYRPDGLKMSIEGAEIQILTGWDEIPKHLHYLVVEWNFEMDNRLHTLAQGFERLAARFRKVHMSKKLNFGKATYDFYPANVHLFGWD